MPTASVQVRSGGAWKIPGDIQVHHAGVWKRPLQGWVRSGGEWVPFWPLRRGYVYSFDNPAAPAVPDSGQTQYRLQNVPGFPGGENLIYAQPSLRPDGRGYSVAAKVGFTDVILQAGVDLPVDGQDLCVIALIRTYGFGRAYFGIGRSQANFMSFGVAMAEDQGVIFPRFYFDRNTPPLTTGVSYNSVFMASNAMAIAARGATGQLTWWHRWRPQGGALDPRKGTAAFTPVASLRNDPPYFGLASTGNLYNGIDECQIYVGEMTDPEVEAILDTLI